MEQRLLKKKNRTRRGNEDENEDEDDIINKLTSAIQISRTKQHIQTFFWELFDQNKCWNLCICIVCLSVYGWRALFNCQSETVGFIKHTQFWISAYIVFG